MKPIVQQAAEVLRRLADPATQEVVYDVETSGLDWKKNFICGYVFTFGPTPDDNYYIPVRHGGGANLGEYPAPTEQDVALSRRPSIHPFEVEFAKIAEHRRDLLWIGHNIKFDLLFSANDVSRVLIAGDVEDTMINQAIINEFTKSFTLEFCATYHGVQPKKGDELYKHLAAKFGGAADRKQMGNFWRLAGDDPIGVDYALGDGVTTRQLRYKQLEVIESQELSKVWRVERRVTRTLFRMERRGIKVDEARLDEVCGIVDQRIKLAGARLPKDLNARAPTQLQKLFTDAGITDWPSTPTGKPSFNEEWLLTNEIGQRIVKKRKYEHLRDSFLEPLRERHIYKGRVHTNYNQLRGDEFGTITGRLSSNDPNLQQVHKRNGELGRLFRSVFVPDDGMTFRTSDYVQIEPCLLAYYGRVRVLLDGFRAIPPIDAHTAVAAAIFGKVTKQNRQAGKVVNQALLTGAGQRKIELMLIKAGVDPAKAFGIIQDYFSSMPEIKPFQREAANRFRRRGYVLSLLGRRARLESADKDYKALNRLLQCGNADIIKLKMVEMDEFYESEGDRVQLLNQIHDDLADQFSEDDRKIAMEGLRIMTDFSSENAVIKLDVPLRVDPGEGKDWAEATYGEEKQMEMVI